MIRVLGIDVPRAAISELALRLHRAGETGLSYRLGSALDRHRDELTLTSEERAQIARYLAKEMVPGLEPLPAVLDGHGNHR